MLVTDELIDYMLTHNRHILIQVQHISVNYPTTSGVLVALRDVTFDVARGEFVSVIGPSGCGKSTLLNVIGSVLEPSNGQVMVNGLPLNAIDRRNLVGFVFQEDVLLPWRSVVENVRLPLEVLGRESDVLKRGPLQYLALVGLLDFKNAYPKELSGGMKQRVGIARALVSEPPLLLMDEPFSALDEITRVDMNLELQRIWLETGKTIVFVTHSINEAVFLSNRLVVLTPRPGQVATIIEVDLPHPRLLDTFVSEEFLKLTSLVREYLHRT